MKTLQSRGKAIGSKLGALFTQPIGTLQNYWATRRQSVFSFGVVVSGVAALLFAIIIYDGYRSTSYDLDEAAVWVTRNTQGRVGRINAEIGHHDAARSITTEGDTNLILDVLQNGRQVIVVDTVAISEDGAANHPRLNAYGVEASTVTVAEFPLEIMSPVIMAGGSTVAIFDPASGEVHVGSFDSPPVGRLTEDDDPSAIQLGSYAGSAVGAGQAGIAVSRSGTFAGYSIDDHAIHVGVGELGKKIALDGAPIDPSAVQLTFVGEQPVLLDTVDQRLFVGDGLFDVSALGAGLAIQSPGDANTSVVVASTRGLYEVGLSDGTVTPIEMLETGDVNASDVVRPIYINGRAYGAWGGAAPAMIVKGEWGKKTIDLNDTASADRTLTNPVLKFRANRNNVVLNEVTEGAVFHIDSDGDVRRIEDWDSGTDEDIDGEESDIQDECAPGEESSAPETNDDYYGARPGRPARLPVLDNDSDSDCDALLIVDFTAISPEQGQLGLIEGGQALQLTPAIGSENSVITFQYTVSDGTQGNESRPTPVTVTVYGDETNQPPELKGEAMSMDMAAGSSKDFSVLDYWIDPEGDPIILENAVLTGAHAEIDTLSYTTSGQVTIEDSGISADAKTVDITVSDTFSGPNGPQSRTEPLSVDIEGTVPAPEANPDLATVKMGHTVTIFPLSNDVSHSGAGLTIDRVESLPTNPATINLELNKSDGSVMFQAPGEITAIQDYKYTYVVRDDFGQTTTGVIRVRVMPDGENRPPTAGHDVIYIRHGKQVTLDLLINDFDQDGDLLAVVGLEGAANNEYIQAVVIEHRRLRVQLTSSVPESVSVPFELTYKLSDGINDPVDGKISIFPVSDLSRNQNPVAIDDFVTVRIGEVATVPVLANDFDPDGDDIFLDPEVVITRADGDTTGLTPFVSGSAVRLLTPAEPGVIELSYKIRDYQIGATIVGGEANGSIKVLVVDNEINMPPKPFALEARVRAGGSTTINVPLVGIDPDGDYVQIQGVSQAPRKGTVTLSDSRDEIVYSAHVDSLGPDEFKYRVVDERGAVGEAIVNVLVVDGANQAPIAFNDYISLRPGATACVPVLLNDYDPDGDHIDFDYDMAPEVIGEGVAAEYADGCLSISIQHRGEIQNVRYWIKDRDLRSPHPGVVHIDVRDDAPNQAPIAKDDVAVLPPDTTMTQISVDVLDNDFDPDGLHADLSVEVYGSDSSNQDVDSRTANISLTDTRRVVQYAAVDADGAKGHAFIRVPSAQQENLPPIQTNDDIVPVIAGETAEILFTEWVDDPEGSPINLTGWNNKVVVVPEACGEVAPLGGNVEAPEAATGIAFTPGVHCFGEAALNFEVTDGDITDELAHRLLVTVRFAVEPAPESNIPPVVRGGAVVQLRQDEKSSISLSPTYVSDPNEDELTFAVEDLPSDSGLGATFNGDELTVTADESAQPGQYVLHFSVTDNKSDTLRQPDCNNCSVLIEVHQTVLPKPYVQNLDLVLDVGTEERVEIIRDLVAPAKAGGAVNLLSAELVSDPQVGTLTVPALSDGYIVFSPLSNGDATIRFTVNDNFADKSLAGDREVTGVITVKVRDAPNAPKSITAQYAKSREVILDWSVPEKNGAEIEKYEVEWSEMGESRPSGQHECQGTPCTISGLANSKVYTFRVRANNGVVTNDGWGPFSEPSAEVLVDRKPSQPQPPTLTFSAQPDHIDGKLLMRWTPPQVEDGGSAIHSYKLEIRPNPLTQAENPCVAVNTLKKSADGSLEYLWVGLENGVEYDAQVTAFNDSKVAGCSSQATFVSEPSGWSAGTDSTPANIPVAPKRPNAAREPTPLGGIINVGWEEPLDNGGDILSYTVTSYIAGSATPAGVIPNIPPTSRAYPVSVADGVSYEFAVTAINKAGESDSSPRSVVTKTFTAPSQIDNVNAVATGVNREVRVNFNSPHNGGDEIDTYRITIDNLSAGGRIIEFRSYSSAGINISNLTNGHTYRFTIQACNQGQNLDYCGHGQTSNDAIPYGPPGAPELSVRRLAGSQVELCWSTPAHSNGRPVKRVEVNINGGGWGSHASGRRDCSVQDRGWSQTHSIQARAFSGDNPELPSALSSQTITAADLPVWRQQTARNSVDTFRNTANASGQGVTIGSWTWVNVSCKVKPAVTIPSAANDGYWYRIASSPWNNEFYAVANTFMNGGALPGEGTVLNVDHSVPDC